MQDFILSLGVQFSDEEKQKCIPTAHRMIQLAKVARDEGILGLEDEVIVDSDFVKVGFGLIIRGTSPDIVEKALKYLILSGGYTGADLLDKLLISESILIIAGDYNPYDNDNIQLVAYIVGAMLGDKYMLEIISKIDTIANKTIDVNVFIDEHTSAFPESENFEKRLLKLTKLELSYLLLSSDLVMLSIAFRGCSKSFIYHMQNGLSEKSFMRVCELLEPASNLEEVLIFQGMILNRISELEDSGMIATQ